MATESSSYSYLRRSSRQHQGLMGAVGSVRRVVRVEVEKLHEKQLNREEEVEKRQGEEWLTHEATVFQLLSEKNDLAEELRWTQHSLTVQSEGWQREKSKATALMFSELPFSMIRDATTNVADGSVDVSLSKKFPLVTLAQCNVAGFASLTTQLQPQEAIRIIDQLHALIDEMFIDEHIFLMERTSDGCIAASGLVEKYPELLRSEASSRFSMTDSSYGSEPNLELNQSAKPKKSSNEPFEIELVSTSSQNRPQNIPKTPDFYASVLASAALRLMSCSTQVNMLRLQNRQLQLRVALHSGPCSAGVIGLQTGAGTPRMPHYKLFGSSVKYLNNLCTTSLALQIRVSKHCQELLAPIGTFKFERCPDYSMFCVKKPIESYWLVGREGLNLKLPSIDKALPLTEYDDVEV